MILNQSRALLVGFITFSLLVFGSSGLAGERSEAWKKFEKKIRLHENDIRTVRGTLRVVILNKRTGRKQVLNGRFWVRRPDEIAVIYDKPSPQTVISRGNQTILYQPEINQVTKITGNAKPVFVDIFSGFMGLFERGQVLEVEERSGFYRVLVLRDGEEIALMVDEESLLPRSLLQVSDEHRTRVDFGNLEKNIKIDKKRFEFEAPEDAEIIEMTED